MSTGNGTGDGTGRVGVTALVDRGHQTFFKAVRSQEVVQNGLHGVDHIAAGQSTIGRDAKTGEPRD